MYNNFNKSKKLFALIIFLLILISVFFIFSNKSYANSITETASEHYKNEKGDAKLKEIAEPILGYIQYAGVAIFLGAIIYYGIQYVQTPDSTKISEIKERAFMWLIAGFLIFAAPAIVSFVIKLTNDLAGKI